MDTLITAGSDTSQVDIHMGHKGKQHKILKTHYLRERTLAVELMRKWLTKVFDSELETGHKYAIITDNEAAV